MGRLATRDRKSGGMGQPNDRLTLLEAEVVDSLVQVDGVLSGDNVVQSRTGLGGLWVSLGVPIKGHIRQVAAGVCCGAARCDRGSRIRSRGVSNTMSISSLREKDRYGDVSRLLAKSSVLP